MLLWTLRGHVLFWITVFCGYMSRSKIAGSYSSFLLVFQWTSILFSTAEAPTCNLKVTTTGKKNPTLSWTVLFCLVTLFCSLYLMFLKDLCLVLLILSTVLLSFHFSHYFYCLPPSFCRFTMLLPFFPP